MQLQDFETAIASLLDRAEKELSEEDFELLMDTVADQIDGLTHD